jgi:pimeloyl-ACP methyl ester carboxylesterase
MMLMVIAYILLGLLGLVLIVGLGLRIFSYSVARKVEAALPPAGELYEVSGGKIHAVRRGKGRPIVMIHGLAGSLQNFTYTTVGQLEGDFEIIALDRPGCGYSERENDGHARIPEQARMIADFLREQGIEKPLIVGHSLGGAIALTLALNHADQIGGLALLAPLTILPEHGAAAFNALMIEKPAVRRLVADTLAVPGSIRNGAKTLAMVFGPDEAPRDFRVRGGGLLGLRPRAFYAASTDFNAVQLDMPALTARFAEIRLPVGVLYGDKDRILNYATNMAALEDAIPQLDAETLPGIGHMVQIAKPAETEAFIRRMAGKAFA